MQSWSKRPTEIAHLLNPAFCALVLSQAVRGYTEDAEVGMPFPFVFLVLPIVLHKPTRDTLPASVLTKMHPWLEQHQQAQVGFADRCATIVDFARESLLYALSRNLLKFAGGARLESSGARIRRPAWPEDSETVECLEKARFVGRWFARAGQTTAVYTMWGVRP
jgi:hypothetical protein